MRSATPIGAALDNPDLLVACVIGDGEAETGPLAASWHANKFLDPATDGAVLPILHLNGWKIANPTVLARIGDDELADLLRGYGHRPISSSGDDPALVHQALAAAMDDAYADIRRHPARGARARRRCSPAVADNRPAHAEGVDGPQDRRRLAGRRHMACPPGAAVGHARRIPNTSRRSSGGCRATGRRSCSTTAADPSRRSARSRRADEAHGLEPSCQRRRAAARPRRSPTSGASGSRCRARGRRRAKRHACSAVPARGDAPQRGSTQLPARRPGRNESPTASALCFEETNRAWMGEIGRRSTRVSRPTGG